MKELICVILLVISTTRVTPIDFECVYQYFALGPTLGERYSCEGLPRGNLSDPIVRSITGNHEPGLNNSDVIGFYIYHDTLVHFIPRGLPVFFPNMLSLAMLNCTLVRLYHDDLVGYTNLQAMSFRQNGIEEIPLGFYEHTPNLINTNMIDNRIQRVGPNILAPLVNLIGANFERNYCVDFSADITTLATLQNILNTNCTSH